MAKGKYSNVSIPTPTFLKLTRLVGHEGFRSTAEVVMHCVRRCMNEIDMMLDKIEKEDILHDIKQKRDI